MNEQELKSISKFLSLVLRHSPETIGLVLDEQGWADVSELRAKMGEGQKELSMEVLEAVVATNDKKRFAFNEDHTKIRASQGHSVAVALDLEIVPPPEYLYHGTIEKSITAIKESGLQKMNRRHVHLSNDKNTANKVGSRRGIPIVLTINAGLMHREGLIFYLSENGVWLTDQVPVKYINF